MRPVGGGEARGACPEAGGAEALRGELATFLARTIERGEELRDRVKAISPGRSQDALLATILRLTEKAREEAAELRRGSG